MATCLGPHGPQCWRAFWMLPAASLSSHTCAHVLAGVVSFVRKKMLQERRKRTSQWFSGKEGKKKVSHSVVSSSFATPWTVALQAPPSVEFSRQEYWGGSPFSSPGDLADPGIEPGSPVAAGRFFTI